MNVSFRLNGKPVSLDAPAGMKVRDLLEREGIVSARNGCDGHGSCGMCAVLLDGRLVNSCLLISPQLEGREVYTVEHLATHRQLSAIQSAFIDAGVVQCGYCTPSMVLATKELLDRSSNPTRDEIKDALSGVFCRCTGYEQMFGAVDLARKRMGDPKCKVEVAPEYRDGLRLVGKTLAKVDGPKLARGERAYVEDMVERSSCHLKMLRSPHAHAYIKRIDTSKAEAIPGVVLVVTYKNCPDVYYNQAGQGFPEPSPYDRKMFGQKVRHVGDRVAAVVAESPEIAAEALTKIEVEYEVLDPIFSIDAAAAAGAPLIHNSELEYVVGEPDDLDNSGAEPRDGKIIYQFPIGADPRRNIAASVGGGIGDIEKGLEEADVVIEREYETGQIQCTPAEPHVVYTRMDGDRLVIHASTQVPYHLRRIIATLLDISENNVRVVKERVGGGFGSKQEVVLEDVAAYCTWVTGRPVLFRFTREEEFIASRTRHPMKIKVTLGAKKDGTLTAMRMDLKANTGPYGSHGLTVPMNACGKSLPLFLCDNVRFDVTTYYTNIAPTGAYQGYGAPKGSYAVQLAAAELADALGMDHLELIEKNRVRDGSMLEILRCLGEGREGVPQRVSSCGLGTALEQGAKAIHWGTSEESGDPDVKIGKGVAIIQQASGLPGLDSANAAIAMLGDGTFMLLSGGADLGTGLDTVAIKMAAECLQTRMEDFAVTAADTDVAPFDVGSYASSGTYFSGGAALRAAEDMKRKILSAAAEMLDEPAPGLDIVYPSTVRGRSKSVSFHEIAMFTQSGTGRGQLIGLGTFTADENSFPYGAHFSQVAVNVRTGQVKVQKYHAYHDSGTPINPELLMGQIYGGVMKTISHSLCEEMVLDAKGKCVNANLRDYGVPMIGDLPDDIRAVMVDTDDPLGPFGSKSIAEVTCNGAAPCLASAIHDAVGVWMRSWPFTPEKILTELGTLGGAEVEAKSESIRRQSVAVS